MDMSFARNVHFVIKNGKVEDFKRLMNSDILPLMKSERGFRQEITVLAINTGMSLSVWDSRTDADTYNSKTYPEVLKKLQPVLEETPRVETYETVFTVLPALAHA
jgi:hypothetical protein